MGPYTKVMYYQDAGLGNVAGQSLETALLLFIAVGVMVIVGLLTRQNPHSPK